MAAGATLLFATEPHFEYFDAIFGYQTLALPLAGLTALAVYQIHRRRHCHDRVSWWLTAGALGTTVLFTHPLTTFALFGFLSVLALACAIRRSRGPAVFCVLYGAGIATWLATQARGTTAYLGYPIVDNLLSALPGHAPAVSTHGSASPAPLVERVVAYVAVCLTLVLLVAGWRRVIRLTPRTTLLSAMAVTSGSYLLVLAVRLFAGNSSELAGRALTFALLPAAAVIAPVLVQNAPRQPRLATAGGVSAVLVLAAGGLVIGWPAWWERLPGEFRVGSFERGVDAQNTASAAWARDNLIRNSSVAGDFMGEMLMGTYGYLSPVRDVGSLFYAPAFRQRDARLVQQHSIRYVLVDERMLSHLAASGSFFAVTPTEYDARAPMTAQALGKFDAIRGVDRIYDGGAMIIYNLRRSPYWRRG